VVRIEVNPPADGWNLTLPARLWADLSKHLFNDDDEHGAVILAEHTSGPRGPRLLGRTLILAVDGEDYVKGTTGYRALRPEFVRDTAIRAGDEGLAYLATHNHFGTTRVGFSSIDMDSHERGYPALRQITGQIVGGLVFTPHAAAGDLWLPDGTRSPLAEVVIPGNNVVRLRPRPASSPEADPDYDRQSRMFGDRGQETLKRLRVAVVGLGGAGSVAVELLARLGVGHLVLIDGDVAERTNLTRLVAAELDDVGTPKVELAARNARRANPNVVLTLIQDQVQVPLARGALASCDWIFLAADTNAARHYVNAAVHDYLIPATQVGVKIPVTPDGTLGQVHAVARLVTPDGGCMRCNGLIDATELAIDMLPDGERERARYLSEVPAPSVIALNTLAVAEAVNHFMFAVTGLHHDDVDQAAVLHRPRSRDRDLQNPRQDPQCRSCSRYQLVIGR